jgi:hypothetical protein
MLPVKSVVKALLVLPMKIVSLISMKRVTISGQPCKVNSNPAAVPNAVKVLYEFSKF